MQEIHTSTIETENVPALESGTSTNRPSPGEPGRLYVETNTGKIFRDDGTSWNLFGQRPSTLSWSDLAIAKSEVSAADVSLGNVENKALSNATFSDLSASPSDVTAADVGLGNVDNFTKTISTSSPSGGSDGDIWFKI